jgi:hypothetical protein
MLTNFSDEDQFNYEEINDDHKKAALEIARLVEKFHGGDIAMLIKQKFDLVEKTRYDITESPFFKLAKDSGIQINVHGWIEEGGAKVHYPLITMCDDIRKFHNMLGIPIEPINLIE